MAGKAAAKSVVKSVGEREGRRGRKVRSTKLEKVVAVKQLDRNGL